MRYRASIQVSDRIYSENLDLIRDAEEYYVMCRGDIVSWKERTRPVEVTDMSGLRTLDGNHILFGWVESLLQSDRSPLLTLVDGQPFATPWEYRFEVVDDV